jgi:hypothetical protein
MRRIAPEIEKKNHMEIISPSAIVHVASVFQDEQRTDVARMISINRMISHGFSTFPPEGHKNSPIPDI